MLEGLTQEQKKQVIMQRELMRHGTHEIDLKIGDLTLKNFVVGKGVWNPAITSAKFYAEWLHDNKEIYRGKRALDLCCGTGIMGIVMGALGAKSITMSDRTTEAYENAEENRTRFFGYMGPFKRDWIVAPVGVFQGDLFENIRGTYDVIVMNQPFFRGDPGDDTILGSMLNNDDLLGRFFSEVHNYIVYDGNIIIPHFKLAGLHSNPRFRGDRFGYDAEIVWKGDGKGSIQQGDLSLYKLTPKT